MKKVLIGCGIIFLVMLVICTGISLWGYFTVTGVVKNYEASITAMSELDRKYPFNAGTDGNLVDMDMQRYLAVRDFVMAELKAQPVIAKLVDASDKGTNADVGVGEIISFAMNYPPELIKKTAEEMDRQKMSPAEYAHLGRLMYSTIDQGRRAEVPSMVDMYRQMDSAVDSMNAELLKNPQNAQYTVDFEGIMRALAVDGTLPEGNFEKLSQYKDRILEFPQLTFFEFLMLNEVRKQGNQLPPVQIDSPAAVEGTN